MSPGPQCHGIIWTRIIRAVRVTRRVVLRHTFIVRNNNRVHGGVVVVVDLIIHTVVKCTRSADGRYKTIRTNIVFRARMLKGFYWIRALLSVRNEPLVYYRHLLCYNIALRVRRWTSVPLCNYIDRSHLHKYLHGHRHIRVITYDPNNVGCDYNWRNNFSWVYEEERGEWDGGGGGTPLMSRHCLKM